MGSLELRLLLRGAPWEGLHAEELQVRLCERGLRVGSRQRPEASQSLLEPSLCGDFPREISVDRCWWNLEVDLERREQVLAIHLAKASDGSWPQPFREGPPAEAAELSPEWRALRLGAAPAEEAEDLGVQAADLIEDLAEAQTEDFATFRVLLKQGGLDQARKVVPMSRMWALDLTEDNLRVFLRSRGGTTLFSGPLGGRVQPAQTEWGMVKVTREVSGTRETLPALEIQLLKAPEYRQLWDPLLAHDADSAAGLAAMSGGAAAATASEVAGLGDLDVDAQGACLLEIENEAKSPGDQAQALKSQGDECFKRRQWEAALELYSRALAVTPQVETLLSNRSAALVELGRHQAALEDAVRAAEVAPQWPKPYFRQGVALRALKRYDMAVSAFAEGLARDARNPSWQKEIEETEAQRARHLAARAARR